MYAHTLTLTLTLALTLALTLTLTIFIDSSFMTSIRARLRIQYIFYINQMEMLHKGRRVSLPSSQVTYRRGEGPVQG